VYESSFFPTSVSFYVFRGGVGTGVWTQHLVLSRQSLSSCFMPPNSFLLYLFSGKASYFTLGTGLGHSPPTYASYVAEITGACHYVQLFCWDVV
jgi:hypothetical protein